MARPDKQTHDSQIIQEKENQRLFKIKKDKLCLQKQMSRYPAADQGINVVQGNRRSGGPKQDPAHPGGLCAQPARHLHHLVPVEAQMQGKKNEPPIGRKQMQHPAKASPAADEEESKHLPGNQYRAEQ